MASIIEKTIGATGRDYATITLWMAGCPANLVTADQVWKGVCYNDAAFAESITLTGPTVDATRYIWLTVAVGNRHSGKIYTTSGARVEPPSNTGSTAYLASNYLVVEYLQFRDRGNNYWTVVYIGCNMTFRNNIVYVGTENIDHAVVTVYGTSSNIFNNLIYGKHTTGAGNGIKTHIDNVFSNTICGFLRGIYIDTYDPAVLKNNICVNNTTDYYSAGATATGSNNLSSDATAMCSSPQINKAAADTVVSVTWGSEDFKVKAGSAAIGNGVDLSATFSIDIVGTTRTTPWDIGCFKYTAAATFPVFAEEIEEDY